MEKVIAVIKVASKEQDNCVNRGKNRVQHDNLLNLVEQNHWDLTRVVNMPNRKLKQEDFLSVVNELARICKSEGAEKILFSDITRLTRDYTQFVYAFMFFRMKGLEIAVANGMSAEDALGGLLNVR